MLSLGRSIIGEHFTNHHKDTLSHTLTDFIQDWSNLLLAWQNWYDELHATGEQSQDLSDQFDKLKQALFSIEPDYKELFPAAVTVENLKSDLKDLQVYIYPLVCLFVHSFNHPSIYPFICPFTCRILSLRKFMNL